MKWKLLRFNTNETLENISVKHLIIKDLAS